MRHWEDVVFENRNKLYGAYILRRAYSNRLLSGMGVTLVLITIMLSLHSTDPATKRKKNGPPPVVDKGIILTDPRSFEIKDPRVKPPAKPRSSSANRAIIVTRDEVLTEEETEAVEDFISSTDFGTGDLGIPDGEGTLPVIEPEPVAEPLLRDFAEVMPQYEGGLEAMMKFIQKRIRYPRAPRAQQIEGTVFVRFHVNGDGSVSNVEVIKGVHPDCDREAVRVISMLPSWKGGSHNGRPVSVRMVLPIRFNLR